MSHASDNHGQLMDDVYRYQRLFYDVTRKYYLLGRDHLIQNMQAKPGQHILEVACGTGRNLAAVKRQHPDAQIYGLDISEQMLISARAKLGPDAQLAAGDACAFDPQKLFQRDKFDHIVLSYSLSMIPDWNAALRESLRHLAPGGTLHIVDFGDQARLPGWFRSMLLNWLARFHVSPRNDLAEALEFVSDKVTFQPLFRSYAFYARVAA